MNDPAAARHYRLTRPNGLGFVHRRSATQFAICCAGIGLGLLGLVVTGAGIGGRLGLAVAGMLLVGAGAGRTPGGEDLVSLARAVRALQRAPSDRSPSVVGRARAVARGRAPSPVRRHHPLRLRCGARPRSEAPDGSGSSPIGQTDRSPSCFASTARGSSSPTPRRKTPGSPPSATRSASLAREESPVSRVTWSQLVAPAPLDGHFAYLAQTSRAEPDEAIASSYGDLLEGAPLSGRSPPKCSSRSPSPSGAHAWVAAR